ncbi:MAG: hypothetical protein WBV74_13910 [Pseudonocardiaceae bacterium]
MRRSVGQRHLPGGLRVLGAQREHVAALAHAPFLTSWNRLPRRSRTRCSLLWVASLVVMFAAVVPCWGFRAGTHSRQLFAGDGV